MGIRRRLASGGVALALLLPAVAVAHTFPIQHRALASARLEDGRLHVDVMLWMQVPAGPDVQRLVARFDLKRDGQLDAGEAQALADELGDDVVGGFVLRVGDKPARPEAAKATARAEKGALQAAVLLSYTLPAADARLALTLRPEEEAKRGGPEHAHTAEWSVLPPLSMRAPSSPAPLTAGGPGVSIEVVLPTPFIGPPPPG